MRESGKCLFCLHLTRFIYWGGTEWNWDNWGIKHSGWNNLIIITSSKSLWLLSIEIVQENLSQLDLGLLETSSNLRKHNSTQKENSQIPVGVCGCALCSVRDWSALCMLLSLISNCSIDETWCEPGWSGGSLPSQQNLLEWWVHSKAPLSATVDAWPVQHWKCS